MADQVITKQELIDAQKDAQTLEDVINGEPGKLIKTRLGREVYTLASVPQINTMTREEVTAAVAPKANSADVDAALNLKAPQANTYNKSEVNSLIAPKADQQYVDSALSGLTTEASKFYPTLAEANADIVNITINNPINIGEVANGGTWYKATADATSLTKSPYDPLTQAKADATTKANASEVSANQYTNNSISNIVGINYLTTEFSKRAINGYLVGTTATLISNASAETYIINVSGLSEISIKKTQSDRFRIAYFNEYPTVDTVKGTLLYVFDRTTIDKTKFDTKTISIPSGAKYITVTTTINSNNVDIEVVEGNYIFTDIKTKFSSVNEKIAELEKDVFVKNAPILSLTYMDVKKAIKDIEFWGLSADEKVYIRTLWNYFTIDEGATYYSSIGFNSSKGHHIATSLGPQNNIYLYSRWLVTEKIAGVKKYLLYVNGDANTQAVGSVTVDWDNVVATTDRFIDTNNLNEINLNNASSISLSYFASKLSDSSSVKKIGAIGDSITWGFTPRNDPNGGTTGAQLDSWLVLASQKLGMTTFNYGISGSTLGANSAGANAPFSRRYQNMANDLDVICVMGGTNDVRKGVPIGAMTDRVDTTFYGALHVICQGLIDKYYINQGAELGKSKQIVLMTPIKLQVGGGTALDTAIEPYVQAVKDVGAYYSIPVLDMYNLSGITPHISQTVQGTEAGYTQTYNVYITDGTHPTQQGHEKMAASFSGFLKTLK